MIPEWLEKILSAGAVIGSWEILKRLFDTVIKRYENRDDAIRAMSRSSVEALQKEAKKILDDAVEYYTGDLDNPIKQQMSKKIKNNLKGFASQLETTNIKLEQMSINPVERIKLINFRKALTFYMDNASLQNLDVEDLKIYAMYKAHHFIHNSLEEQRYKLA